MNKNNLIENIIYIPSGEVRLEGSLEIPEAAAGVVLFAHGMRFDIDLLARRLLIATKWLQEQEKTRNLALGYFGASTGAAAAIQTAATLGEQVRAVVSRGGRPDLAWTYLDKIKSPT